MFQHGSDPVEASPEQPVRSVGTPLFDRGAAPRAGHEPDLALDVTPALTKAQASARALAAVKAKPSGYEDGGPAGYRSGLSVRKAELTVYRTGSTRGIDGEARLAWAVEVWNKATIRESLIIDAATGKPLNRWSMMAHALERHVYEAQQEAPYGYDRVWSEGEAFPGDLTEDQEEDLGTALMHLQDAMDELIEQFDLTPEDLNIDLGPLGPLLPRER